MDNQLKCNHPRTVTSRRNIKYRESGWRVHEFEVWSGEMICRAAVLGMQDSLLVWLGGGGEPRLDQAALGMPAAAGRSEGCAAALLGADVEPGAAAMARRLAAALARPVYVCCGMQFDRFTLPLVERGLIAEIKNRPECF